MSRLNYLAGTLSTYGTYHVALAQARELADHYEQLVAGHQVLQATSPSMDLTDFTDMTLEPGPSRQEYGFAVYTPTSPCPNLPSRSGSSKGKARVKVQKDLPPPPIRDK